MGKRNKLIKLNEKEKSLILQKSNPLLTLSETNITLQELKILDVYLSRINSHDINSRFVKFEKGELEKILNVDRIRTEELKKRLKGLFQVVSIKDKNELITLSLFEIAKAIKDDVTGLWTVELCCTVSAMQYIFNIESLGYLKYGLKNVISLTSRYSYVLYLYLESNRFRRSFVVSLDELKQILNCKADRYNTFKCFNAEILKKCRQELIDKTNLKFDYNTIKQGRKVVAISFCIADDHIKTDVTLPAVRTSGTYSKKRQSNTSYNIAEFSKYDIFE